MATVLETLKTEHSKKLEAAFEALAIAEVEKERYAYLYEEEASQHLEYEEAYTRLESDYFHLKQAKANSEMQQWSIIIFFTWLWNLLCCRRLRNSGV
mmetsp:Transcript_2554/g.4125  ORF Transcript_2554/g.4125 Transcript_2554/m.4125 type:complete len:97 (-) Transcript_2554:251-541(-)